MATERNVEAAVNGLVKATDLIRDALAALDTPKGMAAVFAQWTDDEQARFFVEVARVLGDWNGYDRDTQLYAIGRHLAKCECSTEDARNLLRSIVESMDDKGG